MMKRYCSEKENRAWKVRGLIIGLALCMAAVFALIGILTPVGESLLGRLSFLSAAELDSETDATIWGGSAADLEKYSRELQKLLERNEEAADFVEGYPDREKYLGEGIDMSGDFVSGQVPLLMQWDRRWGYDAYGDNIIGLAGCGPVCLTMAYLYFTENTDMTPREMAEFSYDNGYYTSEGTSWSLWTEGAKKLGLCGEELSLDENIMKLALDEGGLIVCSMGPGDFTTTGHFILIRGYDENGFYVNDPNRRSNSEKQWKYETLRGQIRNLWELR